MITVAFGGKTKQTSLTDFDQQTEIPQSMQITKYLQLTTIFRVKDMVAYLALVNAGISMAMSIITTRKTHMWIRKPFREI